MHFEHGVLRKLTVGAVLFTVSLGTASGASPGVKHFRTLSSNPYNALQPFTTNALCDAEL
jgi:hypothetical protein